ncbi:hypothetical protein PFMALIP_05921, partial [Plasmodium falciparum MaliPS096_E11]
MAPQGRQVGAGGSSGEEDAKNMFDRIGGTIQQQVHKKALDYQKCLLGFLASATYSRKPRDKETPSDPCELDYNFHTNVTSNVVDPCQRRSKDRFSDVLGGQSKPNNIRDSTSDNVGACAPYRRLHVCDRNLEQIDPQKITTTHNLLVDVCLAAKFEGQSLSGNHPKYQEIYSDSQLCTVLARSFADIGDIIRGKDLYRRDSRTDKLEKNLKEIFQKIQKNNESKLGALSLNQVREYWWALNRKEVWKAITCDALQNANYFRNACSEGTTSTQGKCQCVNRGDVPTYFDYVPQYLRWFEEWAEDFCRKRKHKLENAIKNCRGEDGSGKERYCDLNGYDCKKTARGAEVFVKGVECHKCSVACKPFTNWIDNQKQEFEKQKNKYAGEIKKADVTNGTSIKIGNTTINNLYVKEFYEQLQSGYQDVEDFLKKLNNEAICKKPTEVKTETASNVDFTKKGYAKTFSHTEYCQACPWCGLNDKKDGTWERVDDMNKCANVVTKEYKKENITDIPVLTPEKGKTGILQKYKKFCDNANDNNSDQIKNWQCHYDDKSNIDPSDDTDNCILGEWEKFQKGQEFKSYYSFFYGSIIDMLNESIEWKDKLNNCINNNKNTCRNGCHDKCKCYKRWIEEKKKELDGIKDHFRKQKDIPDPADREITLTGILNVTFLQDIEEAYPYEQQLQKIKKLLENKMQEGFNFKRSQTSIDKFLQEELDEANKCLQTHTDNECPPPPPPPKDASPARSGTAPSPRPADPKDTDHDSSDDAEVEEEEEDEDEDEVEEDKDEPAAKDTEGTGESSTTEEAEETKVETVKPACQIVDDLFNDTNKFKDVACNQKYGKTAPTSWKCISGDKAATSGDKGSICVPPRRRRLYVGGFDKFISGESPQGLSTQASTASESPKGDSLLTAFVESAAIETFFLWDRYKKIKEKEKKEKEKKENGGLDFLPTVSHVSAPVPPGGLPQDGQPPQHPGSGSDDPQSKLLNGVIPPDFLRQMFYTLGDYRDILVGNTDVVIKGSSGDKEIAQREKTIKDAIQKFFENGDKKPDGGTTPQTLWSKYAEPIWNGMICALTYKENGSDKPQVDEKVKKAFFENGKNTLKSNYQYSSVTLKDENSGTGALPTDSSPSGVDSTLNTPKLSDFVLRPPYFRWLQEWGQNFCKERKKRLKDIIYECRNSDKPGRQYCSGDGHDCTENGNLNHNNIFDDLNCLGCHEQCRKYRKWIDIKFEEYHNQQSIYQKEHEKLPNNSNGGDNNCCKEIQNLPSAEDFLKSLKHCKDGQTGGEKKSNDQDNKINFNDPKTTFGPLDYCKTCPPNEVNCNRRGTNPCTPDNGKVKSWQSVFNGNGENNGTCTDITVEMINRRGPYMEKKSNDLFNASRLFKGIRKQQWECRFNKAENKDVCYLKNFNPEIDLNDYTTFKVLLIYWLEDFLYGYYLLKKKKVFEQCKENAGETCNENSKNDCACVQKWVEKKESEWKEIKKYFNNRKHQNGDGNDMKSSVKQLLEQFQSGTEFQNAIKPCRNLTAFEKSCGLNGDASSEKSKDGKERDLVLCLIEKLGEKAKKCAKEHRDTTGKGCNDTLPQTLDLDDQIDEDTENKVAHPKICGEMTTTEEQTNTEETCTPTVDPSGPKVHEEDGAPAQEPAPPQPPAPAPAPAVPPAAPPPPPLHPQADEPFDPTILQTTIPFGVALALGSIAFLFLK